MEKTSSTRAKQLTLPKAKVEKRTPQRCVLCGRKQTVAEFASPATQGSRVIKFRAWEANSRRMLSYENCQWWMVRKLNTKFAEEGYDYSVMPFTGLHDKNGKEIYEGDVVRWVGLNYEVVASRACFVLKEIIGGNDVRISMQDNYQMEVIGNIYENPELLKEAA